MGYFILFTLLLLFYAHVLSQMNALIDTELANANVM